MGKFCHKCSTTRDVSEFNKMKRSKDGLQTKCKHCELAYREANREREKERANNHYKENHEWYLEHRKELRQRPEAKIKKKKQDREYIVNLQATNKEKYLQDVKKHCHNRRARLKNNGGQLTTEDIWLLHQDKNCAYCGVKDYNLTMDHVIPLSAVGINSVSNIVMACMSCNSSKQDKDLSDWLKLRPELLKTLSDKVKGMLDKELRP